ncbi:MAG: anaerobic ribonucleoside-triphosphate reductase activating protein [Gammaproteobacteria bacterium]|nr:anaerobic ribonucleoside-triphosphate reductase activating protein [Gammaproteobacteria bacterium]
MSHHLRAGADEPLLRAIPPVLAAIRLGGLVPWSSVDYPGHQSAVLFCGGCPWRCGYCHNSHLWRGAADVPWPAVADFLRRRRGLLDAVVISGGEPLAQAQAVEAALRVIRDEGFATAMHTAGVAPRRLARLLPLLDWIGLDIKAPFARYAALTGSRRSGWAARAALDMVLASGVPCELRTTVHSALLPAADVIALVTELRDLGVARLVLKDFRGQGCADAGLVARHRPWLTPALAGRLRAVMPEIVLPACTEHAAAL